MIFRYPGGKERLARKLLKDTTIRYADISDNETSVDLNDLDDWMGTFWEILIDSKSDVEANQIPAEERVA